MLRSRLPILVLSLAILAGCRGGPRTQSAAPRPEPAAAPGSGGRPAYVDESARQPKPEVPPDIPVDESARGDTAEEVVAALADDLVAQLEAEEEGDQDVERKTPLVGVLPFAAEDGSQKELGAYLADALQYELAASKRFKLIEKRKVSELEANRSGEQDAGHDERATAQLGRVLGTDLVCQGRLHVQEQRCVVICQMVDSSQDLVKATSRGEIRLDVYGGEAEPAAAPATPGAIAEPTTPEARERSYAAIAGLLGRQARALKLPPPPPQEQARLKARVAEFQRRRAAPPPPGQRRRKPPARPSPPRPGVRRGGR